MKNLRFRTKIFLSLALLLMIALTAMLFASTAIMQRPIDQYIESEIERVYRNLESLQEQLVNAQYLQGALLTVRQDIGWAIQSLSEDLSGLKVDPNAQSVDDPREAAIATIEEQVISIRDSYKDLVYPDFILVTDLNARILYSTLKDADQRQLFSALPLKELIDSSGQHHTTIVFQNSLCHIGLSPIRLDESLKGYLCLGFKFDPKLIGKIVNPPISAAPAVGIGAIQVSFFTPEGETLASNSSQEETGFNQNIAALFTKRMNMPEQINRGMFSLDENGEEMVGRVWPILNFKGEPVAYEAVVTSKTRALAFLNDLRVTFLLIALGALIVSGAVGYWISRGVTRPVDILAHAAVQLSDGKLDHKIEYDSRDELGVLAQTMDQMRIAILNRIEQIKALQNELIQKEKLASIGTVASAINHEIRNQLSFGMAAELIRQQHPNDDGIQRYTQMILDARDYILRMLDDLRNFTRAGSSIEYSMERIDLRELIGHTVNFAKFDKELKHVDLNTDCQPNLFTRCDQQRISQVLINLIRNAGHAMNTEGAIDIRLSQRDGMAIVQIEDHGCGIPPENLDKIWQPFFSTKGDRGLGLGLDICRKIVQDHNGRINCVSQVDVGTTFTIELPLASNESSEAA